MSIKPPTSDAQTPLLAPFSTASRDDSITLLRRLLAKEVQRLTIASEQRTRGAQETDALAIFDEAIALAKCRET